MSHRIITIEREYASGGREIGEMIAERLGIPCYNREILQMASERCNVSMEYLETAEEAAPKSFLYTLMLTSSPTRNIEENLRCRIRSISSRPTSSGNWQKKATA